MQLTALTNFAIPEHRHVEAGEIIDVPDEIAYELQVANRVTTAITKTGEPVIDPDAIQ